MGLAFGLFVLLNAGRPFGGPAAPPLPPDRGLPAELPATAPREPGGNGVVLLVFDGFAPSMVEANDTPSLDRIRREGAWSHHMVPAFPTVSLVNGFTIGTGCRPARHGILSNRFLDGEGRLFSHGRDADWLLGCQLLHEVATAQGVCTATRGWYGAYSKTHGRLSTTADPDSIWRDYPVDPERVAGVIEALDLPPEERPELILSFFLGTDDLAHFHGMDSPEARAAVDGVDAAIGAVMQAIERNGLRERYALLVTTDHGMRAVTHLVNAERILRKRDVEADVVASGTTAFVYLDDPSTLDVDARKLSGHEAFDVIRADAPPSWCRLGTSRRAPDIVLSARPPYFIEDRGRFPWYARWLTVLGPETIAVGERLRATHGYAPDTPGMHGVFYAWGAGVAQGREIDRIDAVDVHPTAARLLGIRPGTPLDGRARDEVFAAR
ncbi:MAG: alkaline phosphatase family protein [bacterium]|nr:alkaline phosphatase family protein [bacterium]